MLWSDIRSAYPDQWLIVEALEAHSTIDKRRHLDRLAVLEKCPDGSAAMQRYRELHRQYPQREFYFVHPSREQLDIREHKWCFGKGLSNTNRVYYQFTENGAKIFQLTVHLGIRHWTKCVYFFCVIGLSCCFVLSEL